MAFEWMPRKQQHDSKQVEIEPQTPNAGTPNGGQCGTPAKKQETARDSIERSRQLVAASKKAIEAATSLRRHTKAVTRKPVKSDPRVFPQRTSIQKPISVK